MVRRSSAVIAITAVAITSLVLIPTAQAQQKWKVRDESWNVGERYGAVGMVCELHRRGYVPTDIADAILHHELFLPDANKAIQGAKMRARWQLEAGSFGSECPVPQSVRDQVGEQEHRWD